MANRKSIVSNDGNIELVEGEKENFNYVMAPIIMNGDAIGLVIILSDTDSVGQLDEKLVSIVSQFLGKHIEE